MEALNKILAATLLISLSACKEAPKEEQPPLTPSQESALKDFKNSGEQTKKAYKIEVERAKIDWNTKPKDQKTEDRNSQEKKE